MTILRPILAGLMVLFIVGCSTVPFQKVSLVSVDAVDPVLVREQFALSLPVRFRLINTVAFQYRGQASAAIGFTDVDTFRKIFTVVGLHPAGGAKLFELSGDSETVECKFALEVFTSRGDFAQAIADDIRRIYFDRIPDPNAEMFKEKYQILFRHQAGGGELEHIFAGSDNMLTEKRYSRKGHRIWSVFYYEYCRKDGKLYPAGIILKHYKHQYHLIVRLKEIRS